MPAQTTHRTLAADVHQVPRPFKAFAVRSDEALHATEARTVHGRVHVLGTPWLDAASRARLAAEGRARVSTPGFSDIDYASTTLTELAAAAPAVADLVGCIAESLQPTGVLGPALQAYRASVATRIDYLASRGAGFHNDVARHWSRCLFWVLALALDDVELVMPHAGVRLGLAPGDLLVFDPALAHGLCRPRDQGQAVAESFGDGPADQQIFLTGEILLSDAQWAALGSPWSPVQAHAERGALDLMVAEFDERSGAIKRPGALRDCMQGSTCLIDG
jgi:hypothetical protein